MPCRMLGAALFVFLAVPAALAAEAAGAAPATHLVDLSPLISWGVDLGAALLGIAGTWGIRRLSKAMGLRDDDRVRGYLEDAMQRGLQYAVELAAREAQPLHQVAVRNEIVAQAANYVAAAVPDALTRFGIDGTGLTQRLMARLPEVAPLDAQAIVTGRRIGAAG